MMKHVKPSRPGLIVRDHKNRLRALPDAGAEVIWDITWAKRLRDGDIVLVEPEVAKVETTVAPQKSSDKSTKGAE